MATEIHSITAGFLPLTDSAILIAAKEVGFAQAEDINLTLLRETSWANIRDRMAVGHFDAAHMLAPMPVAANLGLTSLNVPLIAPMALGLGGNAITVSAELWQKMHFAGSGDDANPTSAGRALSRVIATQPKDKKLRFAVVHPHSGHNFELRYWLSAFSIDTENDIEIVIIPPPLMPDAMAAGSIDGFCVGEPWNSLAVERNIGRIATYKAAIWKSSPEKVLAVRTEWANEQEEALRCLIRALYKAAKWCGEPKNHPDLASILSADHYIGAPTDIIRRALSGNIELGQGVEMSIPDFFIPHARAATFPWQSHALWFYSQMVRTGQIEHTSENRAIAEASYRPDLYRTALKSIGAPVPLINTKVEGALSASTSSHVESGKLTLGPDGFFNSKLFDPDALADYLDDA